MLNPIFSFLHVKRFIICSFRHLKIAPFTLQYGFNYEPHDAATRLSEKRGDVAASLCSQHNEVAINIKASLIMFAHYYPPPFISLLSSVDYHHYCAYVECNKNNESSSQSLKQITQYIMYSQKGQDYVSAQFSKYENCATCTYGTCEDMEHFVVD